MHTDPNHTHTAHLAAVEQKLAGVKVELPANMREKPEPSAQVLAEPAGTATEPTIQIVPEGTEPVVVEEVPDAPAKPAPKPANKMARSMEIQRRAEAATRRARAEASKVRPQPKAPESPKPVDPQIQAAQQEIANARAALSAEIQQLKNDPMGFAKRHGVSGADLAEYVRQGVDPTLRTIENNKSEMHQVVAQLKAEYDQKIVALQDTIIATQEVDAQRNFFHFVEESKTVNPDAFAALGSGLVFSDREIWDTANQLLETRQDLRDNFDEDRLLEAVESEARKDPRWTRLQALTKANPKKPNAVAKKSNVSEQEEVVESAQAAPTPRQAPPRDPQSGQFVQPTSTPFSRHADHVERIARTVRIVGG